MVVKVPFFFFGLALWALQGAAQGSELQALQQNIDDATATIADARAGLEAAQRQLATLQEERQRLEATTDDHAERRSSTLADLKAQFERVVADPNRPLEAELRAFREAAAAQDRHAQALAAKEEQIVAAQEQVAALRERSDTAAQALAKLRAGFDRARAQRLLREINATGEEQLTNAISCSMDETIAGCMERGEQTARRVARDRFAQDLFARVTEAEEVAKHRVAAGVEPQVVESTITDSGFRGQGEYFVTLTAKLRTEATLADACRLLGLSDAQCRGELGTTPSQASAAAVPTPELPPAPDAAPEVEPALEPDAAVAETPEDEPTEDEPTEDEPEVAAGDAQGRYRLTVRSNVYYDEVFIDGVPYGSTKLDVMLPPGEYDIEVRKPGHAAYRERVNLTSSRTLRAELAELASQ
jgi:flagellar biosynthesis chaperone FliJ